MHAQRVVAVMNRYARSRSNLALAALAGAQEFRAWAHYPSQDVIDAERHTEFYYHAHAGHQRVLQEHGHFHVFVRAGSKFHHAVGISIDRMGLPQHLFLTNQWVTGERWASAAAIAPLIKRFECATAGRLAPVARWITSMVHLYQPEILALHSKREAWLAAQVARGSSVSDILVNPRYQVVAKTSIHLASRLAEVH